MAADGDFFEYVSGDGAERSSRRGARLDLVILRLKQEIFLCGLISKRN